jgi:hypothetical protein
VRWATAPGIRRTAAVPLIESTPARDGRISAIV